MINKVIYTRNSDNLKINQKLETINLYNKNDEIICLNTLKEPKLLISIPSLADKAIMLEICKIDEILNNYNIKAFLISNENILTQNKLIKNYKLKNIEVLSDFCIRDFARNTGTFIYEIEALVKAVFVIDTNNKIKFIKYYDDLYSNINLNELNNELIKIKNDE